MRHCLNLNENYFLLLSLTLYSSTSFQADSLIHTMLLLLRENESHERRKKATSLHVCTQQYDLPPRFKINYLICSLLWQSFTVQFHDSHVLVAFAIACQCLFSSGIHTACGYHHKLGRTTDLLKLSSSLCHKVFCFFLIIIFIFFLESGPSQLQLYSTSLAQSKIFVTAIKDK